MKEFNVKEFNRLCAELLGFVCKYKDEDFCFYEHKKGIVLSLDYGGKPILTKKLETNFCNGFTTDWNWIMAVVEKIITVSISGYEIPCFEFYIEDKWCKIELNPQIIISRENLSDDFYSHVEYQKEETLKESVVQVIWQFLNWYEKNK